jgi:two-component system, sensor histidine kinase PdtaS
MGKFEDIAMASLSGEAVGTERKKREEAQLPPRFAEYLRILSSFSRTSVEALPAERLMHHVAAQASQATEIKRTKVLRYRPERADLLVEAGVGWNPGVVGKRRLQSTIGRPQAGQSKPPLLYS